MTLRMLKSQGAVHAPREQGRPIYVACIPNFLGMTVYYLDGDACITRRGDALTCIGP